ncbi:hypothetical protein ACFO5K_24885 [Nocardia halotolerans]|uniref:Uncharacterized protein n=1 Tax=Nocardia halotolerans TaxID=1755878 RepID=A0ABV8VQ71_9NOCA
MISASTASQRGGLLRLMLVLAALVGFALMQTGHCQAGPMMNMSMASPVMAATDSDHASEQSSPAVSTAPAVAMDSAVEQPVDSDRPAAPAGIMMACLAMFLALSAAVALLRRPGSGWRGRRPVTAERSRPRSAPPRPPSLAELCVLRT